MPRNMTKAISAIGAWLGQWEKKQRAIQLVSIAIVSASAVVLAVQSYRAIDEGLTAAALSRRDSISYLAATALTEKFDRLSDIAVSLATRVRFRALIAAQRWSDAIEILQDVPRDFPFVDRVLVTDPRGTLMEDVPPDPSLRGTSFSARDWYQGVSRSWQPYVSDTHARAGDQQNTVVSVAAPIRSDSGVVVGVLVMQVKLDTLFSWINDIDFGERGLVYVIDRAGKVAFHSGAPESQPDVSPVSVQKVLRGERGVESFTDRVGGDDRLVAYAPIARYGWGVIAEQPESAAFATKNALLIGVLAAYVLIWILLAGVAYLTVHVVLQREQNAVARRAREELERRVAERTAQLESANKELESFSYSVSHDLRAPLRAIDGFSQLLQNDYHDKLDDEGRRRIAIVRASAANMAQLIEDLLEFSRTARRALATSDIDMDALVREVIGDLRRTVPDGELHLVVNSVPAARGDPGLIRQVWMNLLSNAIKFTGKKTDPLIEIGGQADNQEVMYFVKDNGAGFNMAHYDKLFGVFQRLHTVRQFPGTGVGLAIVHRVIERHGGRVWANAKEGEGATFYFTLPAAAR
jgi:signal transduction histidine kinase